MGTVLLKMNENEFWKCTPRKLFAIWQVYKDVNGIEDKKGEKGYIDDILF